MTSDKARTLLTAKRKEQLEQEAQYIADEYFTDNELIRPEIIAKDENITYTINNYNKDFKGLILYKNGRFHIFLDDSNGTTLNAPVIRYSFAHELGHYFIDEHRTELIRLGILPQAAGNGMLNDSIFEKEAEYFAACLLMPRKRILNDIAGKGFSTWLIHQICKTYKVSLTAAFSRFMVLGETPISIITNYLDGKHDRVLHSKLFPHHTLNLDEYGYIPATSVAGRFCYQGNDDFKTDNLLSADIWFNPKTEEDALRVYKEDCLVQQNLNRIVSIVYEVKL
jgi:hypothetical protein